MPDVGVSSIGETCSVSSEGVTPHSSLLRTHAPIPSGSPLLRPWPRSRSLCRLRSAPAASGMFPTLSLRIFPRMPGPMPRRSHRVLLPVSSSVSSAFPNRGVGRLPALTREHDFSAERFSRLQTFLYVQASEFARLPDRSYRCAYRHRAAETFTSGQSVLRCLRTHRIMLTVRIQAIDGTRTFTPQDSQPCRLLPTSCRFIPAHCEGDFSANENVGD